MNKKSTQNGWILLQLALQTNQLQEVKDNEEGAKQTKSRLDERHQHEMAQISLFLQPLGWAKAIARYSAQQAEHLFLYKTRRASILRRQRKEMIDLEQWITQQQDQSTDIALFDQLQELFGWSLTTQQLHSYHHALSQGDTIIITDAQKLILWTSQSFLSLTGHQPSEVIGQSPQMLQGPATDEAVLGYVRAQLRLVCPVEVELLNYQKGGSSYICYMRIEPLYSHQGALTHFSSVERYVKSAF